jgi:2-polyprenyl-6-methoxyphenol hydroxylase-like FAD-dependent oxidoreductase
VVNSSTVLLKNEETPMRVLIIGGGIGGLAAAIALRNAGHEVHVFERAPALKEVGAGIALWANAIKALDKLGVGAMIRTISLPDLNGGIRTAHGSLLAGAATGELEQRFGAPTLVMHRADLLNTLLMAFDRDLVYLNAECVGYHADQHCVTAQFADGRQMDGDVLIGADGIRSAIRAQMLPDARPRYAGYTAWRAVATFDHAKAGDKWGESWGRGARFGIAPLKNGQVYWFAVLNTPEGTHDEPTQGKQKLLSVFGAWHKPVGALIEAADDAAILRNDIYDLAPLPKWTENRVALLGDAAHATTPNLGQGACQALEDAVVLGQCLTSHADIAHALGNYESQRMTRANRVVALSRQIGAVGQWESPLACWLRDLGMRLMPAELRMKQLGTIIGYEV